jgi:peptidoglycan/LPS O-acetylase OafA/YrhL
MTTADAPRGLYAIGTAGLTIEALVVLLAVPAVISSERGHVSGFNVGYLLGLVVALIVATAVLRRRGGKTFSVVVQVLVVAAGAVSWPMYVVGVAFAGIWVYWLRQWHLPESG